MIEGNITVKKNMITSVIRKDDKSFYFFVTSWVLFITGFLLLVFCIVTGVNPMGADMFSSPFNYLGMSFVSFVFFVFRCVNRNSFLLLVFCVMILVSGGLYLYFFINLFMYT
jgi:hypothetical protein